MAKYTVESIELLVRDIAHASGLTSEDAMIFAKALVDADVHGVTTHGIMRLNAYMTRLNLHLINPRGELKITRNKPTSLSVDAGNGMGHVQAVKVLNQLMDIAGEFGTATATINNSQHFGTLAYYGRMAAERDMILFAATNTPSSVAPTGGCDPYFGTNPLGFAFPTGRGFAVTIDMATTTVAKGKIIQANRQGKSIPEGWALDKDGRDTTDPAAALLGTMLPMSGHKGYALAFMVEVFSGILSGAAIGPDLVSMYGKEGIQNVGHFFMLVDVASIMPPKLFKERMNYMIDGIKAGRTQEGVKEIMVPGEGSHRRAEKNRVEGIPVEGQTLEDFQALCKELKVPFKLDQVSS